MSHSPVLRKRATGCGLGRSMPNLPVCSPLHLAERIVPHEPLVTIALPVFNGADTIEQVGRYVLEQDYPNIELLISDNASTDATPEVCRELARSDSRVRYHRQPHNIGLINNFEWTKRHCSGEFLRWIGDTDEIAPSYVSRCLEVFRADPR